jgi:hypothetical protein
MLVTGLPGFRLSWTGRQAIGFRLKLSGTQSIYSHLHTKW